jgi:hypothetical protein
MESLLCVVPTRSNEDYAAEFIAFRCGQKVEVGYDHSVLVVERLNSVVPIAGLNRTPNFSVASFASASLNDGVSSSIGSYMFSLFSLIFKNSYWQMILRKATWFEAGLNAKRLHKDRRARKHLMALGLMLLLPFLCLAYLAWLAGSGALFLIPFIIPVMLWRKRSEKQDSVTVHIVSPIESVDRQLSEPENKALHSYFAELALVFAAMVDRAGSEKYLAEKELPEGIEVISRRFHLDLLKKAGIWEKMAQLDREAMMLPDGHWTEDLINQVAMSIEPLRLFRWILGIDFFLPVVGMQLKGDFKLASEIVRAPDKVLKGKYLRDVSTIRVGRDAAEQFFLRCMAEAISRGYFEPENEDIAQWAKGVSLEVGGQQHEDLVLGEKLVSEATAEDLLWAVSLSRRRKEFLTWTITVLQSSSPPNALLCASSTEVSD